MTPEKLALKRATGAMIRGVGGVEAAAGFCRVGKSVLSDAQSQNKPECFVALDVIFDLEPLARGRDDYPPVTRQLAANAGYGLVKLPDGLPGKSDLLHLVARLSKDNGEIAHKVCEALSEASPGGAKVVAREARDIRAMNWRLIEDAMAMDAALAAIEAGEAE